jgi:20S proteasome subunit beta 6
MEFMNRASAAPGLSIHNSEGNRPVPIESLSLSNQPLDDFKTTPFERRFNPYDFNGGTTVVIAGDDYAIAAGCTRMSSGYEILSRNQTKLFSL